jgi:hypothetical protein
MFELGMKRLLAVALSIAIVLSSGLLPIRSVEASGNEPGATLFFDDFEDGDSAGWSASGYSVANDGDTSGLKYSYVNGNSTTRYATAGDTAWTNYALELKYKTYTDNNSVGIYARYRNSDNFYSLRISTANDSVTLSKSVSGTTTTLATAPITININEAYMLRLEAKGTSLAGYVNGVQLVSANDSSISSGKIAVGGYSKGRYIVDNVRVTDLREPTSMAVTPQNAALLKDESRQYTATVYDQSGAAMSGLPISWNSSAPNVASVSASGFVTALQAGTSVIRAVYGQLEATSTVAVQELVPELPISTGKTLAPITVDGNPNEAEWTLDRIARKPVIGSSDNTINFGTLWDDKYLYVGVQVQDAGLYNDSQDSFEDDSVELFLDADHSRSSTLDVFDWHFRTGYNDTVLYERASETVGSLHAWSAIPGGYAVELAIPWLNLGITPAAGTTIGFDIAVNDDDNGGMREGQLVWSGTENNYKNTFGYGELALSAVTVGTPQPPVQQDPVDRYVTPQGAGTMDGSSWANAFKGDMTGGLQAAWESTGATNSLYIGSGSYNVPQTLNLTIGGTDWQHLKKLAGVDTGGGLPEFRGDFALSSQGSRKFIDVPVGVSYWQVQDIVIRNYFYGIYANGQNVGFRILNVSVHDMSDGVYLWGKATRSNPNAGSHDIVIRGGEYTNFTKRAVRFRNGNYLASVIDVHADSGGQAIWTSGNFPFGFSVGNSPAESPYVFDHDIVFQDVTAEGSWHEAGSDYWNGDGFTVERSAYNITYLRSKAFNATDGGYDDKSSNPVYIDTVAIGNKRNYRLWSKDKATLIRAIGGYSYKRGGSGDSLGLHVTGGGNVDAYYSTFYNNQDAQIGLEDAVAVNLYDSIIGNSNGRSLYHLTKGQLNVVNSDEFIQGVSGTDPAFVNGGNADWRGGSDDFNSQTYGNTKGYVYPGPNTTPYNVQINASELNLGPAEERTITAQVLGPDGQPVPDPENVIWYSDDSYIARLLQSRGPTAIIQGLNDGTTDLIALYKGAESRIHISVAQTEQDLTAPVTTDNAPSDWTNQDVVVTLSATDGQSVVAATYYSLNGGQPQKGTSVAVTNDGVHTLAYWSVDSAGNSEPMHTTTVKVDKTAPATSASLPAPDGLNGWYVSNPTITLTGADALSSVTQTVYRLDGGSWNAYVQPFTVKGDGVHGLEFKSEDAAGNREAAKSVMIKVDGTPPTMNVLVDKTTLWPANHKMVPVHANIQVQDNLPGQSTVVLASITSSEPASGPAADVQEAQYGSSDSDFLLRAERSGAGSGRVYKITYTAADEAGNKTSAVVSVVVPHDQSGK